MSHSQVHASSSPDVLRAIARAETVAAIWKRPLPSRIAEEIERRPPSHGSEAGVLVWAHDHRETRLEPLVRDLVTGVAADDLLADMRQLVDRWFTTARLPHAFVSLAAVLDDACKKLHVDHVGLRLLATYAGAGTEFLAPADGAAWHRDPCCFDASAVQRLARGDVIVMKGSAHPASGGIGLVHRSPPRVSGAPARLLFRICDGEYHLHRPRTR